MIKYPHSLFLFSCFTDRGSGTQFTMKVLGKPPAGPSLGKCFRSCLLPRRISSFSYRREWSSPLKVRPLFLNFLIFYQRRPRSHRTNKHISRLPMVSSLLLHFPLPPPIVERLKFLSPLPPPGFFSPFSTGTRSQMGPVRRKNLVRSATHCFLLVFFFSFFFGCIKDFPTVVPSPSSFHFFFLLGAAFSLLGKFYASTTLPQTFPTF